MRKVKLFFLLTALLAIAQGAWAGTKPDGRFDQHIAQHGSLLVRGWTYDPDQPEVSLQVQVKIWHGTSASGSPMQTVVMNTDVYRYDVYLAKHVPGIHGFFRFIAVPAGTYTVEIYAFDITGDGTIKLPIATTGRNTETVTEDPYNITYDANGGSDAPDAQQKGEYVQLTLRSTVPTREGYTFSGWNTAQDGSGDSYAPGAPYAADADVTLYAQWTVLPTVTEITKNQWQFTMPDYDVELEVEYYDEVPTNVDPENPGVYYYSTFYHSTQKYALTNDGTQAFVADLSGSDLILTEIAKGSQVIPANTAVILRKTGSADPVVLNPTEENGVSVNPDENSLEGVDAITAVTSIDGLTTTNCYVLSGTNENGVGFYRINSDNLKAHKAYVKYVSTPGQGNAPKKMRFVFEQENTTTGVENVQGNAQSTKVLENGVLYIIKNGVRYNAQGQVVK